MYDNCLLYDSIHTRYFLTGVLRAFAGPFKVWDIPHRSTEGVQGTKSLAGVRGVPAKPPSLPPEAAREKKT
jgi:hypothetical protein